MKFWNGWRWLLAALMVIGLMPLQATAAGPIETSIFAVQGVDVDVTAKDASAAKDKALMDVQVKAFFELVTRLGSPEIAAALKSMKPEDIAPYLKSLSIEQESSAPGRYIGKFTVRFLPAKVRGLLSNYGVSITETQAKPVVVLPLWKTADGLQLWDDNPWRKAWLDLRAEQAIVPLIVPLGDLEDSTALSPDEALAGDPVKIEAIRRRYDAPGIVVALAEPAEGGVRVVIRGDTPLGKVNFDKVYTVEDGTVEGAIAAAISRFDGAMTAKFKQQLAQASSGMDGAAARLSLSVAVPFSSPSEWNRIRSRILSAPNVVGVDVSSLSSDGAVINLVYTNTVDDLQVSMQSAGLAMSQIGGTWVIQPL